MFINLIFLTQTLVTNIPLLAKMSWDLCSANIAPSSLLYRIKLNLEEIYW